MPYKLNHLLPGILLTVATNGFAETAITTGNNLYDYSNNMSNLTTYLENLGKYFGYDITQFCTTGGACSSNSGSGYSNSLFNANDTYTVELNVYNSYLGALLGGGSPGGQNYNPIVPPNIPGYSVLNTLSGQTYVTPPYSIPSQQNVSASELIDQPLSQTYQANPVSQAVLNILSTPNATFCTTTNSSGATIAVANCQYLYREQIMSQIIGPLQKTNVAFSTAYNQPLVSQLNSDTLLSPLLYSTTSSNTNGSNEKDTVLTAYTQAEQAANFIRYVSSSVTPPVLPSYSTYNSVVAIANNDDGQTPLDAQNLAQATLFNYLTRLRTYAAQTSVGMSNLYYMLSKRLPQAPVTGNGNPSSEALNEFIMASWRLYNPTQQSDGSATQQWLTKINQGSNATVQKEIAILLAEINYQLYLTRQQQERLLLTQSIMLIQNSQTTQPDSDLTSTASAAASSAAPTSSNQ